MILLLCVIMFFFFFSSRRRHTRLQGDWRSDVCSSDLAAGADAGEREEVVWIGAEDRVAVEVLRRVEAVEVLRAVRRDRKSTRLNSSHLVISYAVFCLENKSKLTIIGHASDSDI